MHKDNAELFLAVAADDVNKVKALISDGFDVNAFHYDGRTPLMLAISLEMVKTLIDAGAEIDRKDKKEKQTALNYHHSSPEIALYLIDRGADVKKSENILHEAIENLGAGVEMLQVVKALINAGADVNSKNKNDITPLHSVLCAAFDAGEGSIISKRCIECAEFLLESGADINAQERRGYTPLLMALREYSFEFAEFLLKKGADVNIQSYEEKLFDFSDDERKEEFKVTFTPLYLAVDSNLGERPVLFSMAMDTYPNPIILVNLLIEKKADLNSRNIKGRTPLMAAASRGSLKLLKILLDSGANIDDLDDDGKTALMYAVDNHPNITSELMKRKADINVKTNNGMTAFLLAVKNGDFFSMRLLAEGGVDVNQKNNKGETALMIMDRRPINTNVGEVIDYLISEGARIDEQDNNGNTALMNIVNRRSKNYNLSLRYCYPVGEIKDEENGLLYAFLDRGADPNKKNNAGLNSLMSAVKCGSYEVAGILLDKGADINAVTDFGKTALIYSLENKDEKTAQMLIEKGADVNTKTQELETPLIIASKYGLDETAVKIGNKTVDFKAKDISGLDALYYYELQWKRTERKVHDFRKIQGNINYGKKQDAESSNAENEEGRENDR